jgi:hypothetical protein
MRRPFLRHCISVPLFLLFAFSLFAQKGSPPKSSPPAATGPSTPMPAGNPSSVPSAQNPPFVYGKLLTESGAALPNSTSIQLDCESQFVRAVHPQLNGTFQFDLRGGLQSDEDMSAAVNPYEQQTMGTMQPQFNSTGFGAPAQPLSDCDLRVSAPGYQPFSKFIEMQNGDVTGVNAGVVVLSPLLINPASAVSVNTLLIPKKARKEFEKGQKDIRRNDPRSAAHHFQKAVAEYDKFAAAWNGLGAIDASEHQDDKAAAAFAKAIAADSTYVPPYLNLAELQIQSGKYEEAADTAGKALAVSPGLVPAGYLQALAEYKLNRFDAAESSARVAERGPTQNIPQLHLLLADICLRKNDYSGAAAEMRSYLKEFPNGKFAGEVQSRLPRVEKLAAAASAQSPAVSSGAQAAAPAQNSAAPAGK